MTTIHLVAFLIFMLTCILLFALFIDLIIFFFKVKPFPKKLLLSTLAGIAMFAAIFTYIRYSYTFDRIDMQDPQKGPGPELSPLENYSADAYFEPYGGAAGGVNVWVEVSHNDTTQESKVVYYADAKQDFSMDWIDETTLVIENDNSMYSESDRSIELDIRTEIYDESGRACRSLLMKNTYEHCYQY